MTEASTGKEKLVSIRRTEVTVAEASTGKYRLIGIPRTEVTVTVASTDKHRLFSSKNHVHGGF